MSYLLDALNKSKGDQPTHHSNNEHSNNGAPAIPQPAMYPSYTPEQPVNVYKWVSIILALVLTLIVGIVLGNKYALLGVPQSSPAPIQTTQQTSSERPTHNREAAVTQQAPQTTQTAAQTTPDATPKATPQATKAPTESNSQEAAQLAQTEQNPEPAEEEFEGEPQVVGYEPETITTDGKRKDTGIDDISNDLLSKFNQAIKETEGTEESYAETSFAEQANLQADQEVDGYLTRVPRVSELKDSQQMQVPAMVYETHLYSSDRFQRWVKINGRTMQETQWVTEDIQIHEIQKQFLILEMGHIRFSVPALTDWPGYGK